MVCGVKRVEGRSWSTSHRGVLWIHSAARPLRVAELCSVSAQYPGALSSLLPNPTASGKHAASEEQREPSLAELTKAYPTGVLLGYVHLDAVLPREEHLSRVQAQQSGTGSFPSPSSSSSCSASISDSYPLETTECEYAFVCSNAVRLPRSIPLSGQHKIWRLPAKTHQYARAQLNMSRS
mmetsp:Transcript_41319/g.104188  ORF Transcript_41319/g.104188 Transcript_41319/m.104188 type:complete len:180 (-) Transcript_41319:911-1450(-)